MKKSYFMSLIAVFAAFNVVCDVFLLPHFSLGIGYGLVFLAEPITGIVLDPYVGFLSTFSWDMVGHLVTPRGFEEFLFTVGAPVGAVISGFLFQGKWKMVFSYYTTLLESFFIMSVSWQLPLWGMWDVYFAYFMLFIIIMWISRRGSLC